jgi:hypothetical protein
MLRCYSEYKNEEYTADEVEQMFQRQDSLQEAMEKGSPGKVAKLVQNTHGQTPTDIQLAIIHELQESSKFPAAGRWKMQTPHDWQLLPHKPSGVMPVRETSELRHFECTEL